MFAGKCCRHCVCCILLHLHVLLPGAVAHIKAAVVVALGMLLLSGSTTQLQVYVKPHKMGAAVAVLLRQVLQCILKMHRLDSNTKQICEKVAVATAALQAGTHDGATLLLPVLGSASNAAPVLLAKPILLVGCSQASYTTKCELYTSMYQGSWAGSSAVHSLVACTIAADRHLCMLHNTKV